MQTLEIIISHADEGKSVKTLLKSRLQMSTALIDRLKRSERGLLLNGCRVRTTALLRGGDLLTLDLSDPPESLPPLEMPLSVLYEDDWLLIINKPAGIAVHAASLSPDEPTLANALAFYLGPGASFHLVSRLDRGTSGLMTVAKCSYIHDRLRRVLHTGEFVREYLGIAEGHLTPEEGVIDLPIGRDPSSLLRRQITPNGLPAQTAYKTLLQTDSFSLLRLRPQTGRTHQLRLHLAATGHPLAGDWLYGREDHALIPRPALHSARLSLVHPISGERISLEAPLPEDMARLIEV